MTDATGDESTGTPDLTASSEVLERLLADAEREIAAIRAELEARRLEEGRRTVEALPDDLSNVQGHWADLRSFLSELLLRND